MRFKILNLKVFSRSLSGAELKDLMAEDFDYLNDESFECEIDEKYIIKRINEDFIINGATGYE
ncbi:hypothetical protein [Geoglobus acetivorans]